MRVLGPAAGWSWLVRGIKSGFRRPKTLFGAVALFGLIAIALGVVQIVAQLALGHSLTLILVFNVALVLVSVVVYPVLCGGYLRVLDAIEHDRSTAATDVFGPFRSGGGAGRLARVGIGMFALYALFLALIYFTVGHGVGSWYVQLVTQDMPAVGEPAALPPLPDGFAATFAILVVFVIFYSAAFCIALGQAALRDRPAVSAIKDGLIGALKNLLPLLVLALCSLLACAVFMLAISIVVGVVLMMGSLVSKALGLILILPVYVAVMLLMYAVMLGVMYAVWQDVAGDDPSDVAAAPAAQIEI